MIFAFVAAFDGGQDSRAVAVLNALSWTRSGLGVVALRLHPFIITLGGMAILITADQIRGQSTHDLMAQFIAEAVAAGEMQPI